MSAVSTCQSSYCDSGFLVDKHFTLFNPGIQRCPSDSGFIVYEVKIYNASCMFWIPFSFKIQAGVFPWFATLEKNTYGSILMIDHRRFAVVKQTVDFIHALVPLTACIVSHL